ncbi:MAG: L,D-transpeptidase family protein [Syntrophobacter sp.]
MKFTGGTPRGILIPFILGVICLVLCSCSLFESKIRVPVAKKIDIPVQQEPQVCNQPYCSTNLDFPLSLVSKPMIYVNKAERRLWLIQDQVLVRDYHVGLGPSPRGDKYFRGDGRTPEGEYFICSKNGSSQYYKSLGINYPNPKQAECGLTSGAITYSDYCQIVRANDAQKMPPSNTALGGLIMIHGGGCHMDWTLGCVAVENSAMDELFQVVKIGTPVYIVP